MHPSSSTKPVSSSDTLSELAMLNEVASSLRTLVTALGDKLAPILKEDIPNETTGGAPLKDLAPLANSIRDTKFTLGTTDDMLSNILRRIDL